MDTQPLKIDDKLSPDSGGLKSAMDWSHNRLWSLWDMLTLKAKPFVQAITTSKHVSTFVEKLNEKSRAVALADDTRRDGGAHLTELLIHINLLEARCTAEAIKRLQENIKKPDFTNEKLGKSYEDITQRFLDELVSIEFLCVESKKQPFYSFAEPPFGKTVATQFPSVSYEIEEAAKCYALERSTASAFHSIRCLEAGIRAISRCLDIPDPTTGGERSWARILEKIDGKIKNKWTNAQRLNGDGQLFETMYAALAGMQNPWRNATMHLDQKYTDEEARHIFEIVGGFMKKVASRMDENGEPKA